jgi:cell division cycle 20-like protein 1 (cofactor of APC complex)
MNDQTPIKEVDLNKQSWTSPKDKSDRFIPRNVQ